MPSVELPAALAEQLKDHRVAGESLDRLVERALTEWAELRDGRTERGGALAVLLDEVGASARREHPLPSREELGEWLLLLNVVGGSNAGND